MIFSSSLLVTITTGTAGDISFICAKELLSGRKILGVLMGLGGIVLAAFSRGEMLSLQRG